MTVLETKKPEFTAGKKPEFTIGIRGYDRAQVDRYIDYLQGLVVEADERAHSAETEYVFDQHAAVGPRIAEIFALAEAEARELRERVATEATQLVSEARTEARAIVDAAEHSAQDATDRARRDHEDMLAELQNERDRIREEVAELEMRKAEAIGELNYLRDVLGQAAGIVDAGHAGHDPLDTDGETTRPTPLLDDDEPLPLDEGETLPSHGDTLPPSQHESPASADGETIELPAISDDDED